MSILKFFLHISKDEQKKRFLERIDDPDKRGRFRRRISPSGSSGTIYTWLMKRR